MGSRFLSDALSLNQLTDGTGSIFVKDVTIDGIKDAPLKCDSNGKIYGTKLLLSDLKETVLTNPFDGTLQVTDLKTDTIVSLNDTLANLPNVDADGILTVNDIKIKDVSDSLNTTITGLNDALANLEIQPNVDADGILTVNDITIAGESNSLKFKLDNIISNPYANTLEVNDLKITQYADSIKGVFNHIDGRLSTNRSDIDRFNDNLQGTDERVHNLGNDLSAVGDVLMGKYDEENVFIPGHAQLINDNKNLLANTISNTVNTLNEQSGRINNNTDHFHSLTNNITTINGRIDTNIGTIMDNSIEINMLKDLGREPVDKEQIDRNTTNIGLNLGKITNNATNVTNLQNAMITNPYENKLQVADLEILGTNYDSLKNTLTYIGETLTGTYDENNVFIAGHAQLINDNKNTITTSVENLVTTLQTHATSISANETNINTTDEKVNGKFNGNTLVTAGHEQKIANNTTNIGTNLIKITTNTTNIGTNLSKINVNTPKITTNTTNIGINLSKINVNTPKITTNTTNIGTNLSKITTNTPKINTNTTNIGTNLTKITTNTTNIATNLSKINVNTPKITTNLSKINTNTTNIATNTPKIATNTTNIGTNLSKITTNTTNIGTNLSKISTNTGEIAALKLATGSGTDIPSNIVLNPHNGTLTVGDIKTSSITSLNTSMTNLNNKTQHQSVSDTVTDFAGKLTTTSEREEYANQISLYPISPVGSHLGGISIKGRMGVEYPLIQWDAWTGGGGAGDCDYVRFYAKGQEVFNIRDDTAPNSMSVTGNLHVSGDIILGNTTPASSLSNLFTELNNVLPTFSNNFEILQRKTVNFDETGKYVGTLQVDDIKTSKYTSINDSIDWNDFRLDEIASLITVDFAGNEAWVGDPSVAKESALNIRGSNFLELFPYSKASLNFQHHIDKGTPLREFSIITDTDHTFKIVGTLNGVSTDLMRIDGIHNTVDFTGSVGQGGDPFVKSSEVDSVVAAAIQAGQSGGSGITIAECVEVIKNLEGRIRVMEQLFRNLNQGNAMLSLHFSLSVPYISGDTNGKFGFP